MSLPVEWLAEAIDDAREARRWYRKRNPATAKKFSGKLKATENWIATMPQASSPGKLGTRFVVLHTYPYVVHFRIEVDRILILAVAHSRRHPDYWHTRLS